MPDLDLFFVVFAILSARQNLCKLTAENGLPRVSIRQSQGLDATSTLSIFDL